MQGLAQPMSAHPSFASSEARGFVDPPVVVTAGPKHPLFFGGVYEPSRAARWIAGPAFARREVSWPRPAETRVSPRAGKPDNERAHPLGDEREGGWPPRPRPGGHGGSAVRSYRAGGRPDVAEIMGAGREWTVSMISLLSIPWR